MPRSLGGNHTALSREQAPCTQPVQMPPKHPPSKSIGITASECGEKVQLAQSSDWVSWHPPAISAVVRSPVRDEEEAFFGFRSRRMAKGMKSAYVGVQ